MLDRLTAAITDLPVIIQGALGSGLFALLLFVGQRLTIIVSHSFATSNKRRQKRLLRDGLAALNAVDAGDDHARTHFGVIIIYRMARYLVRALFWLTLGLIFGSVISVFGLIGYLGCLYYLLQALRIIQGVPEDTDIAARILEIEAQLRKLAESGQLKSEA